MSLRSLIGFISAALIFAYSTISSMNYPAVLVDWKSMLIVGGGTFCATIISFPLENFGILFKVFLRRVMGANKINYSELVQEIVAISQAKLLGDEQFESAVKQTKNPFLRESASILFWAESDIQESELRDILETRVKTHYAEYMSKAKVFQTISKFPPAFGMMGTTIGMIALLQTLGGSGGLDNIGPGMAVALITTLYGVALANFIFIPIAENLTTQTKEDSISRHMILEATMLIYSKKPTRYIEQKAMSFLLPEVRNKIEGLTDGK